MLQNTFSDVTDLSHVKPLSDQIVARGEPALGFEEYQELLLSACSTYEKNNATPRSGQRNVYSTIFETDDDFYDAQDDAVFGVDTDVSDLLAHVTDFKPHGASTRRPHKSYFIPRDEWLKLSTEER
jgi:hypothetical protein